MFRNGSKAQQSMRHLRARLVAAVAVGALGSTLLTTPLQAHQDGSVDTNDFVFYYNSYWAGSLSDFAYNSSNLAGYVFLTAGSGQGQAVKNNSASVKNRRVQSARVYYNSNFVGASDLVGGLSDVQLSVTYNQNASFRWV